MRVKPKLIPRCGRFSLCLLLAGGCAPDQFVSMGTDVGGTDGDLCLPTGSVPASSGAPSTTHVGDRGGTEAHGGNGGTAGSTTGLAGNGNSEGGAVSNPNPAATGGTIGPDLGVVRPVLGMN
jgi:hypothetical protein